MPKKIISIKKNLELTRLGLGIGTMFGIFYFYVLFIHNHLNNSILKPIMPIIVLYGLGGIICHFIISKGERPKLNYKKLNSHELMICFFLQFFALWVQMMLTTILMFITHKNSSPVELDILYVIELLIFNPIVEEYFLRKLFADRILKYGEMYYIFASALCFAIPHAFSVGLPAFVYTFILGMLYAYMYVKTGDFKLITIYHSLSNLFSVIIPSILSHFSNILPMPFFIILSIIGINAFIHIIKNKKHIKIDGTHKITDNQIFISILKNGGIIFHITITLIAILVLHLI